jgi:hypothetical protein
VSLEEQTLDPLIERRCAVCDATLSDAEIEVSIEAGGPFLCSVHAAETAPADDVEAAAPDVPPDEADS